MAQDGVPSTEEYNSIWEQRFWAKEGGLKVGEVRCAALPASCSPAAVLLCRRLSTEPCMLHAP